MALGKRELNPAAARRLAAVAGGGVNSAPAGPEEGSDSNLTLVCIGVGAAIAVGLALAVMVPSYSGGKEVVVPSAEELTYACPAPQLEKPLVRTNHQFDAQTLDARLSDRANALLSGTMKLVMLEVEDIERYVDYISCRAAFRPARFCDTSQRDGLIEDLRTYVGMRRKARAVLALGLISGNLGLKDFDKAVASGWDEFESGIKFATGRDGSSYRLKLLGKADPKLRTTLRGLIESGYLSERDFNDLLFNSVPAEFTEHFQEVTDRRQSCL